MTKQTNIVEEVEKMSIFSFFQGLRDLYQLHKTQEEKSKEQRNNIMMYLQFYLHQLESKHTSPQDETGKSKSIFELVTGLQFFIANFFIYRQLPDENVIVQAFAYCLLHMSAPSKLKDKPAPLSNAESELIEYFASVHQIKNGLEENILSCHSIAEELERKSPSPRKSSETVASLRSGLLAAQTEQLKLRTLLYSPTLMPGVLSRITPSTTKESTVEPDLESLNVLHFF